MTLFNFKRGLFFSFAVIPFTNSATLVENLSQNQTNGNSSLGTLNAPLLPQFVTANNTPLPDGYPWATRTANNTDPYKHLWSTPMTRYYDFNIERGFKAPDGVNRSVIMINGQIPGPTIEANWGDTIQVRVTNNIDNEGTTIHWHGLLQRETPWFDGVPSVQQCPIAPGSSFTYSFKATVYGTSWYHSHYSAQYADGLSGPIVIHGPKNAPYDIDLGPVFVNDWYHNNYTYYILNNQGNPTPDNNLINGKGEFNCTGNTDGLQCVPDAGLPKFSFTSGKTHRLRLINSGVVSLQRFSIDGYQMTVIANDFVPVVPYNTSVVTLATGQRTDVLVYGSGKPTDAVWMRANTSELCSPVPAKTAFGVIYYEQANTTVKPTTSHTPYQETGCGNDPLELTTPYYNYSKETPLGPPATTQQINITLDRTTGKWEMNGEAFVADYDEPILLLANQGNVSYPLDPQWSVYNFGSNASVRIILYNNSPAAHPMHLHGHNFWVLAEGQGRWSGTYNTTNPQRRDTQIVQAQNTTTGEPGYAVLQFDTDNPGVWPLHCHIAWHVSYGLYVNVMEKPANITGFDIPSSVADTCTTWENYKKNHTIVQIDSGV